MGKNSSCFALVMLFFGHALLWSRFALVMLWKPNSQEKVGRDLVMIWSCVALVMLCFGHALFWSCFALVMLCFGHALLWSCFALVMLWKANSEKKVGHDLVMV